MRVVYLSTLDEGGPVSHLRDLVPRVAAAGADVVVFCRTPSIARAFADDGVRAEVAPVRSKWDVRGVASLLRRVGPADVVHGHDRRALLVGSMVARRAHARLVYTCHGLPDDIAGLPGRTGASPPALPFASRLRLRAEAVLGRSATWVVPSAAMAEFLVLRGLSPDRVAVLPSRIDVRRVDPGPAHTPLAVGTAGRLIERKGVDVLIAACAAAGVPLRLHVYGDGPLRAPLEAQARQLGVDAQFHGSVTDVRRRLEDLDVFVLPSRGENLPIAVLEAMAAALPVVGTRVGGVPEMLDAGTGVLVEPDDIWGMAAAIRLLATDEACRRSRGRAAAARIRERFDSEAAGREMLALYERACASST